MQRENGVPPSDHKTFRAPTSDVSDQEHDQAVLLPEKITFNESTCTLLLNLRHDDIPTTDLGPSATTQGIGLKPEFHITAIGYQAGTEIQSAITQLEKPELVVEVSNIIQQADFNVALKPTRLHITKNYPSDPAYPDREPEHRESFIQMVEVPGLHKLYNDINALLGTHLEPPPTHITLFTGSNYPENASQGIGIPSQEDLEKLNPETI